MIAIERPGDRFYTALLGFLDGEARTPLPVAQAARFATINYLVKAPAGIDFSKELGADSVSWLARSNASALDLGIERLIERFTNVGFNWKSPHFVEWRKVAEKLETADEKADRELYRALLGDSLLTIPRPEDFDSIRVQDIRKWRDAVHRPENASLIVVGPDSAEALDSARKHLSSWKRSVPRAPRVRPPALPRVRRSGLSLALLAKPGSSQTVLRLACRLPKHTPESIAAEEVLAERVRHVLDRTLREELGSSYYVHAEVDRIRGGLSVLRISTAVGNSRVEGSVPLLLESLTLPGFDEAAIAASREALLSGFVFETSTTAGLARRIFEQRRLGFRPELYSSFEKRLARVSPGAIEALLAACRKSAVLSAVGDVDEVERVAAPFVAELR